MREVGGAGEGPSARSPSNLTHCRGCVTPIGWNRHLDRRSTIHFLLGSGGQELPDGSADLEHAGPARQTP